MSFQGSLHLLRYVSAVPAIYPDDGVWDIW